MTGADDTLFQPGTTATRLKVTGVEMFSAGDFLGDEGTEEIMFRDAARGVHKRLVLRDDRLIGAVLYGEAKDGAFDLIQSGASVGEQRDTLVLGPAPGGGGQAGVEALPDPGRLRVLPPGAQLLPALPMARRIPGRHAEPVHQRARPRQHAEGRHLLRRPADVGRRHHGCRAAGDRRCGREVRDPDREGHGRAAHQPARREEGPVARGLGRSGLGVPRNCAEATIKDFGVVAVESSWELHVGGNGGVKVRATDLLCKFATADEVQIYREEAHYLERTAHWIERVGLEGVRKRVVEDAAERGRLCDHFLESQQHVQHDPWAERAAGEQAHEFRALAEIG